MRRSKLELGSGQSETRFAGLHLGQVAVRIESAAMDRSLDRFIDLSLVRDQALAADA